MTSTEIININGEVCSGKMKGIHDEGEVRSDALALTLSHGEREQARLQQLSQTINVGLDRPSGDIAPRARATDHQRIITVPAAFDSEDVVAR